MFSLAVAAFIMLAMLPYHGVRPVAGVGERSRLSSSIFVLAMPVQFWGG